MRLVIAEKKLTAEAIAKAIFDKFEYKNKVFKGTGNNSDVVIAHCSGHLISLKDPHEYDEKLKKWDIETLPFMFRKPKFNVVPHHKDMFNNMYQLIKTADVVYHAGDPDDEGQLIVDEVLNYAKYTGTVKRIIFSDNNPIIVKKAFENPIPNEKYIHEGFRALGRSLCDWHYGLNLTRAFTCLHERKESGLGLITLGRVQDAVKGLVVRRCREIADFVPRDYFIVSSQSTLTASDNSTTILKPKFIVNECQSIAGFLDSDDRLTNLEQAQFIVDYLKANPKLKVLSCIDTPKTKKPPLPYNLLKLQIDMNRKYGLSLDETLAVTQSLRDNYNAITYNRSDCQYLSDETFADSKEILNVIGQNAPIFNTKLSKVDTGIKSKCFNSSKVSAHHAIIPTFDNFDLSKLSENEKKCYFLIARSFIAQFYPDKKYTVRSIKLASLNNEYVFSLSARQTLNEGWEELYRNDSNNDETTDDKDVPEIKIALAKDDFITLDTGTNEEGKELLFVDKKQTQPPKHYTEDTLAIELTRVARYINDPQLKKIMIEKDAGIEGEHGGIGTPATRGEILKNLFEKAFFVYDGKKIIATEKCHVLYDMLPDPVRFPDLTALWQSEMKDIKNPTDVDNFLTNVMKNVTNLLVDLKQQYHAIEVIEYDCPDCVNVNENGKLKKRAGQYGAFWSCIRYKEGCKYSCTDFDNKPSFEKPVFNNSTFNKKRGSKRKAF